MRAQQVPPKTLERTREKDNVIFVFRSKKRDTVDQGKPLKVGYGITDPGTEWQDFKRANQGSKSANFLFSHTGRGCEEEFVEGAPEGVVGGNRLSLLSLSLRCTVYRSPHLPGNPDALTVRCRLKLSPPIFWQKENREETRGGQRMNTNHLVFIYSSTNPKLAITRQPQRPESSFLRGEKSSMHIFGGGRVEGKWKNWHLVTEVIHT